MKSLLIQPKKQKNDGLYLKGEKIPMTLSIQFVITNPFTIGLMAMEPQTGNIKAWVGYHHKYF
jgi:hypothetical protein